MAVKKKTTSAPKIGFVGFGNMAQAMAKGWKSAAAGVELFASSRRAEVLKTAAEALGVTPVASNRALAEAVDVVVVAVKPYLVAEVIAEMGEALKGKLVISVAGSPMLLAPKVPRGSSHSKMFTSISGISAAVGTM